MNGVMVKTMKVLNSNVAKCCATNTVGDQPAKDVRLPGPTKPKNTIDTIHTRRSSLP